MNWEEYIVQCECTQCKNIFMIPDYGCNESFNEPNFCPFCGIELTPANPEK